jgi:hypothetical protein
MPYGGHSADLLFHIIMSELQYIIPDSPPKILSGRKKYLLGVFIYWAAFIYSGHVYLLGCVYLFWAHLFMFILSAYVRSDKHSLTFRHYSGMSAPYPKPHPSSLPLESEPACPCPIAKVHARFS